MNVPMFKKKGNDNWYVRKQIRGERKSWCTGTNNFREAQSLGREWARKLMQEDGEALRQMSRRRASSTIGEALEAFENSGVRRCSKDTAHDYALDLRILIRDGGGLDDSASLDELTQELVTRFYKKRLQGLDGMAKLKAAGSANKLYRQSRSIFGRRTINDGVFEGLTLPLESLRGFCSCNFYEQHEKVYEAPPADILEKIMRDASRVRDEEPGVYVAFMLALCTGVRAGEAAWLEWRNFSEVQTERGKEWIIVVQSSHQHVTKSKKSRRVPVHKAIVKELYRINGKSRYVIPGSDNYRKDTVWRNLSAWFKSHGWDREKKAHELRGYFGAQVATSQGLYQAQKYLGHSTPVITNKYYADLLKLEAPALDVPDTLNIEG